MGCIALVRCVLVLLCGLAVVVWYPYAGFSLHTDMVNNDIPASIWRVSKSKIGTKPGDYDRTYILFFLIVFKHVGIVAKVGLDRFVPLHCHFIIHIILPSDDT